MNRHRIALIPGDGVGTEVLAAGLAVLRRVGEVTGASSWGSRICPGRAATTWSTAG